MKIIFINVESVYISLWINITNIKKQNVTWHQTNATCKDTIFLHEKEMLKRKNISHYEHSF